MYKDFKTGLLCFSPSDLMAFMDSQFQTWMNRYKVEFPESVIAKQQDEDDEMNVALQNHGHAHEARYFDKLKSDKKLKTFEVPREGSKSDQYELTKKLMSEGYDVIFQARLEKDEFAGYADILFKREGKSSLGNFYYSPWDTKLSRSLRAKYAIQLCCYGEMLEEIQGIVPDLKGGIILGDGSEHELSLTNYKYYYRSLKESFLKLHENFNPDEIPDPAKYAHHGDWSSYAEKILAERDHLSLVARITKNQIKILETNGIKTVKELADCKLKHIHKLNDEILNRLIDQAQLQVRSRGKERPEFKILKPDPLHPRTGLAILPPPSKNDMFFDLEGYPLVDGGLEYLWGVCYYDKKSKLTFKDWWAHDHDHEKVAFEGFIDWAYKMWKEDPSAHIYHYASYERTAINRLMLRYGTREKEVDELYTHGVFIDLYEVVRNGLRVGEPAYSIKNIEHLYREKRDSDVTNAASSVVWYNNWLQMPDGKTWDESETLKGIRDYNIDDVESTAQLAEFLRKLQKEAGIKWAKKVILTDDEEDSKFKDKMTATTQLRDKMLKKFSGDEAMETLAWLLEWQRRENKPKIWQKFARLAMTTTELFEDADCLAQVKIDPKGGAGTFDPGQETKLKEGDSCIYQEDAKDKKSSVKIVSINYEEGTIVLKSKDTLPSSVNLIPNDFFAPEPIRSAVYEVVESVYNGKPISNALMDFLYHRRPNLKKSSKGPILDSSKELLDEVHRAVSEMQKTTLVIQGPPGAGKTHTAASTILKLISAGKRVGITSNSHKAIINLVEKVLELNKKEKVRVLKVGGDENDLPDDPRIVLCDSIRNAGEDLDESNIICGTAWCFANPIMKGNLDYLFVDEASQISTCYLAGMSRSTDNIVLMGDQMQLQQPSQSVHPGLSGESCLEYYLQGKATIPEDLGIFLPFTWRMHPSVNDVVSEMVYEGRLKAAEHTQFRTIKNDNKKNVYVNHEAGIVFIPVEHTGNSQTSPEEIKVIQDIINELIDRTLTDHKGKAAEKVSDESFLVVAPYNLHVNNLKKALPNIKIGTVDKFQGQEAPISILSLCTSTFEDATSSRGVGFLFSKNRLNVALSRAKCLSIVVGCPDLINTPVKTLEQMELVNFFCKIAVNLK